MLCVMSMPIFKVYFEHNFLCVINKCDLINIISHITADWMQNNVFSPYKFHHNYIYINQVIVDNLYQQCMEHDVQSELHHDDDVL